MPKTNERIYRIFRTGSIIAGIVFTIFAMGGAWIALNGKANNAENIAVEAKTKADSNELSIVELKTDVKYIRESVEKTEKVLDKIWEKL